MINRSAIILKYKPPAIAWINKADPYNDDPGITIDFVNQDRTIFLISDDDGDGPDAVQRWVKRNYEQLFINELGSWYTDPSLWPSPLDYRLFQDWFDVESHSMIVDTLDEDIVDDRDD